MTKITRNLEKALKGYSLIPVIIEVENIIDQSLVKGHNLIDLGFNMFSGILTPESIELISDMPFIKRIYLDTQKKVPEIPEYVGEIAYSIVSRIKAFTKSIKKPFNDTMKTRKMVGADEANSQGIYGKNVTVGIIDSDSGITVESHQQLRWRASSYNARAGWSGATNGHGCHVTTIVGGNYVKIFEAECMGMAPEAKLVMVKSLLTPMGMGMDSDIIKGLSVCINKGARVINMSLGSKPVGPPEEDPICQALMKLPENVIVCAASGNDGEHQVGSPAYAPNVLAINALNPYTGEKADFSNYGPESAFIMPGVDILSGVAPGSMLDIIGRGYPSYSILSGTSQATPHASGLIALMVEYFDRLGYTLTARDVINMGKYYGETHTDERGYGVLKWEYAVKYAKELKLTT